MAGASSNIDSVWGAIREMLAGVAMNAAGNNGTLGDELLDVAAEGMRHRTVDRQEGPDGAALKSLTEAYLAAKSRKGQPETIGVATGEMLSMENLRGVRAITAEEASATYGASQEARDRAAHFEEGGREFWGLDEAIGTEIRGRVAERIAEALGGA